MRRKKEDIPAPDPVPAPRISAPLSGVRLMPFSGDQRACTKCGNFGAATRYYPSGMACDHRQNDGYKTVWGVERLHRTCNRCEFSWDEACVSPVQEPRETLLMPVVPQSRRDRKYG